MSKAADIAKVSAKGSFHLLWGLVASTIISAVGMILIARLLGPAEYGIYTISLAVPTLIGVFRDWGISAATIKYGAQYKSEGKNDQIRSIFVSALLFETTIGIILFLVSFFIAGFLATDVYNRPQISFLMQISSAIILTGAITAIAQGAFTGIEKMELNSLTMLIQSVLKTTLVVGLVIIGMGTLGAVTGAVFSSLLAAIASLFLLRIVYRLHVQTPMYKLNILANTKTLLKYGLPLAGYFILGALLPQFYNSILPIYTSDTVIGNYSVANNFVILITFFATPITTVMFPAFSKLNAHKDGETLRNVYKFSVKYASLLVIPAAFMVIALSGPAVSILFGNKYGSAPLFLALLAIGYVVTAVGSLSNGNLINGQGETKFMLKMSLLMAAIGFPLGLVLISNFGVLGLILAINTAGIPCILFELNFIKKKYNVSVDYSAAAKITLSSTLATIVTLSFEFIANFNNILKLLLGGLIFMTIVIIALIKTKTITKMDIKNLREMISPIQSFQGISNRFFAVIERIMDIFGSEKDDSLKQT